MNPTILDTLDMHRLGMELQRARKRKGLTQEEAAQAINVKRTTMVAIEQGNRRVSVDELITLARLYDRTIHELLRARPELAAVGVQFRGPALRTADHDQAITPMVQEFEDLCRDYWELELKVGSPLVKKYPAEYNVAGQPIEETAESIALEERNRLGLGDGPIPLLRPLFENDVGIRIFYLPLAEGFSEIYTYLDELGGCLAVNRYHPETRRRWSLAHGYFHFLASRHEAVISRDGHGNATEQERVNERFAETFARYFLMPSAGITRRFNDIKRTGAVTPSTLCTMAYYYGVSHEALVRRLEGLHLLPANMWERLKNMRWSDLQHQLGLEPLPADDQKFPVRYRYLALEAVREQIIGEAEFARLLELDRVTAREMRADMEQLSSVQPLNTESDSGE